MSAISKALTDIKYIIPVEVLNLAFNDDTPYYRKQPISLDEIILLKVIRPRVLYDCNMVGGQEALVPLDGLLPDYSDSYTQIYTIPKNRTDNRSIMSALSISYFPYAGAYGSAGVNYSTAGALSQGILASTAQRAMDSYSATPPVSVAYVDLIGENVIMFRDSYRMTQAYFLRCVLANEDNLNNINIRSYSNFSKLCELAIKSYIYTTMVVKIDQAYLQGGQQLGAVKEIIDEYKDSEQMYQDYLKQTWASVSKMNDIMNYNRFIKLQINPGI